MLGEVTDHAIDLHDVRPVRKRRCDLRGGGAVILDFLLFLLFLLPLPNKTHPQPTTHPYQQGEVIDIPYELTISPAFRDQWQSAFYSHDRLNTSTPFARKLGFQDQVLPFSLMLFLAGSMSHADSATVQVWVGG